MLAYLIELLASSRVLYVGTAASKPNAFRGYSIERGYVSACVGDIPAMHALTLASPLSNGSILVSRICDHKKKRKRGKKEGREETRLTKGDAWRRFRWDWGFRVWKKWRFSEMKRFVNIKDHHQYAHEPNTANGTFGMMRPLLEIYTPIVEPHVQAPFLAEFARILPALQPATLMTTIASLMLQNQKLAAFVL